MSSYLPPSPPRQGRPLDAQHMLAAEQIGNLPQNANSMTLDCHAQYAVMDQFSVTGHDRDILSGLFTGKQVANGRVTFGDLMEALAEPGSPLGGVQAGRIATRLYLAMTAPPSVGGQLKAEDPGGSFALAALRDDVARCAVTRLTDDGRIRPRTQERLPAAFPMGFDAEALDRRLLGELARAESDPHFRNALHQTMSMPSPTVGDLLRAAVRTEPGERRGFWQSLPLLGDVVRWLLDRCGLLEHRAARLWRSDLERLQLVRSAHAAAPPPTPSTPAATLRVCPAPPRA